MASHGADDFRLTVLNPGGRDREQHFRDAAGPAAQVNRRSISTVTRPAHAAFFHHDTQRAIAEATPVCSCCVAIFELPSTR